MFFEKLPAIRGEVIGCLCCGGNKDVYPLDSTFAVGFGDSRITRDEDLVYSEGCRDLEFPTLRKFEEMAASDPDHDWRLERHGPLKGGTWQRHGPGAWVLVMENDGFA
jgi:hypothetical protein